MKKLLLAFLLFATYAVSGQTVVDRSSSSSIIAQDQRAWFKLTLRAPVFADTTAANTAIGKDSMGLLIVVPSIHKVYFRDTSAGAHKWTEFALNTPGTVNWADLGGSPSDNSDLMTLFDAKQDAIATGTASQYFRGDLSLATFPTDNTAFTNGAGYLISALGKNSITGTGITGDEFELDGDAASPGANKHYGTNGGGTKGWITDNVMDSFLFQTKYRADTSRENIYNAIAGATGQTYTGAANNIDISEDNEISVSENYVGSTSITVLGHVGTGTWEGQPIADDHISSADKWNAGILPPGGTAGQIPVKNSDDDFDVSWGDQSGGGNTNSNVGSGFRLAKPTTNDIKTLTASGATLDSTTTDQIGITVSDATINTSDITTNNASTSKHGFVPKLPDDANKAISGKGNFSVFSRSRVFNVEDFGAVHDGVTDDTDPIQDAINAAVAARGGTVWFPVGVYIIGGALKNSLGTDGSIVANCQIYIPVDSTYTTGVYIRLEGEGTAENGNRVTSPANPKTLQNNGVVLYSTYAGTFSTTVKGTAIIGSKGYSNGFNYNGFEVNHIKFLVKNNPNGFGPEIGGINARYSYSFSANDVTYGIDTSGQDAVVPIRDISGIETPDNSAGGAYTITNCASYGVKWGFIFGEHVDAHQVASYVCYNSFGFKGGSHASYMGRIGSYWYVNAMAYYPYGSGSTAMITVGELDMEYYTGWTGKWYNSSYGVVDSLNRLSGSVKYTSTTSYGDFQNSTFSMKGGVNLDTIAISNKRFNGVWLQTTVPNNNIVSDNVKYAGGNYTYIAPGGGSMINLALGSIILNTVKVGATGNADIPSGSRIANASMDTTGTVQIGNQFGNTIYTVEANAASLKFANRSIAAGTAPSAATPDSGLVVHSAGGKATVGVVKIVTQNSGTFTSTLSSTTNVSSTTFSQASYLQTGNQIHASVGFTVTPITSSATTVVTFTLPVTTATTSQSNIGSGTIYIAGAAADGAIVDIVSATTGTITFYSTGSGSALSGNIQLIYKIN